MTIHPITWRHRMSIKTKIEMSHPDDAQRGGISSKLLFRYFDSFSSFAISFLFRISFFGISILSHLTVSLFQFFSPKLLINFITNPRICGRI